MSPQNLVSHLESQDRDHQVLTVRVTESWKMRLLLMEGTDLQLVAPLTSLSGTLSLYSRGHHRHLYGRPRGPPVADAPSSLAGHRLPELHPGSQGGAHGP